jgi:diadenylate cyclase
VTWLAGPGVFREYVLPLLDILLLSYLIYKGYQILAQTRAVQLFKGAVVMGLIYLVAFFLRLSTLMWILNLLVPGLVIGIAIIFQPELRRIFTRIGQQRWLRLRPRVRTYHLEAVLNAVEILSQHRPQHHRGNGHAPERRSVLEPDPDDLRRGYPPARRRGGRP